MEHYQNFGVFTPCMAYGVLYFDNLTSDMRDRMYSWSWGVESTESPS